MSVRENTYVVVAGTTLVALTVAIATTVYVGRACVHSGERAIATQDMASVGRVVADEQSAMRTLAQAIAAQTSVVCSCQTGRPLSAEDQASLASLDADALLVLDGREDSVYATVTSGFCAKGGTKASLGELLSAGHAAPGPMPAVIDVAGTGMLVASSPVTKASAGLSKGAALGTVVVARQLDLRRLARIGESSGAPVHLHAVALGVLPRGVRSELSQGHDVAVYVQRPLDITAYLMLRDAQGRPVIALSSAIEPSNYAMGVRTVGVLVCVLVAAVLAWATALFLAVDRIALTRFTQFRRAISVATDRANPSERIALAHDGVGDEVSDMASDVNALLGALEIASSRAHDSEEQHRILVENMPEAVFQVGPAGDLTYVNPQGAKLVGRALGELEGEHFSVLFDGESSGRVRWAIADLAQHDVRELGVELVGLAGEQRPVELSISAIRHADGTPVSITLIARDITERRVFESRLRYVADHDHLTNAHNRRRFEEEVSRYLAEARRHGSAGALLWCDLDGFKAVNDNLGHQAGDSILVGFADLLADKSREQDFVARLGGDEFAVLLPGATEPEARGAAARIARQLRIAEFNPSGHRVTVSIGVALYPEHALSVDGLLSRADEAMYDAKSRGRDRASVYGGGLQRNVACADYEDAS